MVGVRQIYNAHIGLGMGSILLILAAYDLSKIYDPELQLSSAWRPALIFLHVLAFYLFGVGYIYCIEAGSDFQLGLCYLSLIINVVAFVLRLLPEFAFSGYRPAEYQ